MVINQVRMSVIFLSHNRILAIRKSLWIYLSDPEASSSSCLQAIVELYNSMPSVCVVGYLPASSAFCFACCAFEYN